MHDEEASAPPASSRLHWRVTAVVGARLGAMLADRPSRARARGQSRRPLVKGAAVPSPAPRLGRCSDSSNSAVSGGSPRGADTAAFVEERRSPPALSLLVRCGRPDVTTETLAIPRERKPLRRRLAGHGRLGWGPDKAARPNSIDAVATLVAVSSSKPANALASLEPAEVRTPSRR
jgi:hypothetical protein